jgi:hypothetical protein
MNFSRRCPISKLRIFRRVFASLRTTWITKQFGVDATSVRYLDMLRAKDRNIFQAAKEAGAIVGR